MNTITAPYRHMVLFRFKPGTTPATTEAIVKAFRQLALGIPLVTGFEWGRNSSPENLDGGLTHCFLLSFANPEDRDAYLPHPAHQAFVKQFVEPHLEKVCVVDYQAQE